MNRIQYQGGAALDVRRSLRRTAWAAAAIIGVFFGGFGTWAAMAPLAGAAVAPAVTHPAGKRRKVQHLEGGLVKELLVSDGSVVAAGEPMIVLDATNAAAERDILEEELRSLLAQRARLKAERDGDAEIVFPEELPGDESAEGEALIETQRALFEMRRATRLQRKKILEQQFAQLEETVTGVKARIDSQEAQLRLLEEEAEGVETLVTKGLERRPRLLSLQRSQVELAGATAAAQADIARTTQAMSETLAEIEAIETGHQEEVSGRLAEIEAKLPGLRQRLKAAEQVVRRTVITAPVAGTVVQLDVHTVGRVIGAGETVLEIVPSGEELVFDARISPTDIEEVEPGQSARIILVGLAQRNMPKLVGHVRQVSADRITDPRTNQPYYLARVELPADEVGKLPPEVMLKPGMPAEIMVTTRERTALDYLLEPLLSSFRKSFRES